MGAAALSKPHGPSPVQHGPGQGEHGGGATGNDQDSAAGLAPATRLRVKRNSSLAGSPAPAWPSPRARHPAPTWSASSSGVRAVWARGQILGRAPAEDCHVTGGLEQVGLGCSWKAADRSEGLALPKSRARQGGQGLRVRIQDAAVEDGLLAAETGV